MLRKILEDWDQAGERPYKVLQELGYYDYFMDFLGEQEIYLSDCLYRGTVRHYDLLIGDILDYNYPTSWTSDYQIASYFIEDSPKQVILELCPAIDENNEEIPINGILNQYNSYDEQEAILHPQILIVSEIRYDGFIKIISLSPYSYSED